MDSYTPKYIQIQEFILDKVNSGEYKAGDKVPSEDQLAKLFEVSRITTNKALSELEILGIVQRVRGKGTFVRDKIDLRGQLPYNHVLSKSYKISSESAEHNSHTLEEVTLINGDEFTDSHLVLAKGEQVYRITRHMVDHDMIIGIDYSYIPVSSLKDRPLDESLLARTYIHEYLEKTTDQVPQHLHVHISTRLPHKEEQKILGLKSNSPVLIWESNVIDQDNRSIALTVTVARPDLYHPFINFDLKTQPTQP